MTHYEVTCSKMDIRVAARPWKCEESACMHDDRTIEPRTEYLRVAPTQFPGEWTYHLDCGFAFYDARPAPERPSQRNGYQHTHKAGEWLGGCGRGCIVAEDDVQPW